MNREAFEKWCLKNTSLDLSPFDSLGCTRHQGDDYYDQWETEIAWLAWQAAAPKQVEVTEEKANAIYNLCLQIMKEPIEMYWFCERLSNIINGGDV